MHWTAKLELIAFLQATSGGVNDSRVFVHKSERFAIYKSRGLILPHCEDLIKRHKAKIYYLPLGMFGASTENLVGRLFEIDLQWKQFEDLLVAIILRKRTMLITTAKWMTNLPCPSMTPEKRPGKFLCWKNYVPDMSTIFGSCVQCFCEIWTSSTCQGSSACPAEHEIHSYGEEIPGQIWTSPSGF